MLARLGPAIRGAADALLSLARHGWLCSAVFGIGPALQGSALIGSAWLARLGPVRLGSARRGKAGSARLGWVGEG